MFHCPWHGKKMHLTNFFQWYKAYRKQIHTCMQEGLSVLTPCRVETLRSYFLRKAILQLQQNILRTLNSTVFDYFMSEKFQ